jgi:hypothetical protein
MAIVFHIEGHFFALFYFFSYLTWQYVMCTTWCITSFMQCLCHIIYLVLQHKLWHPINLQHYMITYVSIYIMMYMINFLSCFVSYFTWCFVTEWLWDSTISMSCFCYIILAILQHELWDIPLSLWWFFKWHWAVWWSSEIMLALFHPHQNTDEKREIYIHGYCPLSRIKYFQSHKIERAVGFWGEYGNVILTMSAFLSVATLLPLQTFWVSWNVQENYLLRWVMTHTTLQYGFVLVDFLLHLLSHWSSMIVGI